MIFTLNAFAQAVGRCLSPYLAQDVRQAHLAAHGSRSCGDATLTDTEAGELLLSVLCRSPAIARASVFASAYMIVGPDVYTLSREDVARHPLLSQWVADSMAEAITAPMVNGALINSVTPGAPSYGVYELVDHEGLAFEGVARLRFDLPGNNFEVLAYYGAGPAEMVCASVRRVSGNHLALVGFHAAHRQAGSASPVSAHLPVATSEVVIDLPPTRH